MSSIEWDALNTMLFIGLELSLYIAVFFWLLSLAEKWFYKMDQKFYGFKGSLSPEICRLLTAAPANEEHCVLTVAKEVLAEVIVHPPKGLHPLGITRTGGGPETSLRLLTGADHE